MKESFTAKTLEEAKQMASEKFGVSVDYIVFRILEKPKKGFLGLGKKEEYVVEAAYEPMETPAAAPAPAAAEAQTQADRDAALKEKLQKEAEAAAAAKVAEEKRLAEEAKKAASAAAPAVTTSAKPLALTHNEAEGRWDLVVPKSANGMYKVTIGAEGGECWFGVYQDKKLVCVTGLSYKTFVMDKTLEHVWDDTAAQFMKQNGITVEKV